MRSWSGGDDRPKASKGWQGGRAPKKKAAYGWQQSSVQRTRRGGEKRRSDSHWRLYTLLGAVLLAVFLYLLLIRPSKTPVLLLIGVDYQAPVSPNAWAAEDRDGLLKLDQTLAVSEVDLLWQPADGQTVEASAEWQKMQSLLAEQNVVRRGFRRIREPVVLYVSMPGVVDRDGRPCLMLPGASAFDSRQWLPVESLLKVIDEQLPEARSKLLVLDCHHELVNWPLGIVYNTFAERVADLADTSDVKNLAVLAAAGPGQQRLGSAYLGGSVFGQYFRLGVAGAADLDGPDPNGVVSLRELADYLRTKVSGWARLHRDATQAPVLVTTDPEIDFPVTYALDDEGVAPVREALSRVTAREAAVDQETLGGLWNKLDALQRFGLVQWDPLSLAGYRKKLVTLERLTGAGRAYAKSAERLASELNDSLAAAEKRAQTAAASSALADHWVVTGGDQVGAVRIAASELEATLPNLAVCEYLGQFDRGTSNQIHGVWKQLTATVNGLEQPGVDNQAAILQNALPLAETQLLAAAHQRQVNQYGSQAKQLGNVLALRGRARELCVPRTAEGLPGDERAHYLVRRVLAQADQLRRQTEDELFLNRTSLQRGDALAAEADKQYDASERVHGQVAAAFAVCDRVSAEMVELAQWLCRPDNELQFGRSAAEVRKLVRLIDDHRQLCNDLSHLLTRDSDERPPQDIAGQLSAAADDIDARFKEYRQKFDVACKERGTSKTGKELLAIESVLTSPLVPSDLRIELWQQRDRLAATLHDEQFGGDSTPGRVAQREPGSLTDDGSAPASAAVGTLADAIDAWEQQPLFALLSGETADRPPRSGDRLGRLEATCAVARQMLVSVTRPRATPATDAGESLAVERQPLVESARHARIAAAFWPRDSRTDPIGQLRLFDVRQLLLWHAERALDEFWNTVTSANPKTIAELLTPPVNTGQLPQPPWFAAASQAYLRTAQQIGGNPGPAVRMQIDQLTRRTADRAVAAKSGLQPAADSQPSDTSPADVVVRIAFPGPAQSPEFPLGTAAVALESSDGPVEKVTADSGDWGWVQLPVQERENSPGQAVVRGVAERTLDAVVFFRGHQFRRPFDLNTLGGAVVQYAPPEYARQSVTLYGNQPTPPAVVFILDCSYSMADKLGVGREKDKSKMVVAVNSLQTMLDQLAARQTSRPQVGVRFFGHRVGWYKDSWKPNRSETVNNGAIPLDLAPAEDVELVLPLGAFNAQEHGEIRTRLDELQPLGHTPVNLAILQSLQNDFNQVPATVAKSIIVITDGRNDQTHRPVAGFKPIVPTTTDGVINYWNKLRDPISVHIVGFRIKEEERDQAEKEFRRIANRTNGKWISADSGAELIEELRKRLNIHGYLVREVGGPAVTSDPNTGEETKIELNTQVDVSSNEYPPPVDLDVEFQSIAKRVTLEGGERLQLEVSPDGKEIDGQPYDRDVEESALLVNGASGSPTDYLLRVHTPRRANDSVHFRISVQNRQSHFTARPRELWIEVFPKDTTQKYLFYDPYYEPDTPVPVVAFAAANWPPEIDQARVNVWCSYDPTSADQTFPLSAVRSQDRQRPPFRPVSSAPGVELRVAMPPQTRGQFRILVDERFQSEAATTGAIRVWLDIKNGPADSLQPSWISRRFDAANGVAKHQFHFDSRLSERDFAERVAVRIAGADKVKRNALRLPDDAGLMVDIVDDDASHVPNTVGAAVD